MCFRRTRVKHIIKQHTLRGGEKRGGTEAKRVDEIIGFSDLQLKNKYYYKTTAITFLLREKKTQNQI